MKRALLGLLVSLLAGACSPTPGPQGGSQTNWLVRCESSLECGSLECVCGVCTATCTGDADCDGLGSASCLSANDAGAVALCAGQAAPASLCLPRCDESSCGEAHSCVAGVCTPDGEATASVSVDETLRYQTLEGFGTSFGFAEDELAAHPHKLAIYDAMADAGLDALRFGNRHEGTLEPLRAAGEIVVAMRERLGRTPLLFMTSASPPAALKANGSRTCAGNPIDCTLASLPTGEFDYAGLANYFRTSLAAYASVGIEPDFLSIQNNPNWVPPADNALPGCRFLPREGTATVTVDGVATEVAYPGYAEAIAAVRSALADLPAAPKLAAPEVTGVGSVDDFLSALSVSTFDSVAIHLYGEDAASIDEAKFAPIRSIAERTGRPVQQTEMRADGLDTAILVQHALTHGGASLYLQNDLTRSSDDPADVALFLLGSDHFETRLPYHALAHFAKHTDPGWIRVAASSEASDVLSSAFLAPDASALTLILVNASDRLQRVRLGFGALRAELERTEVRRTVFSGVERSTSLGELSDTGIVEMPAKSVVTVALAR
jgi:glucuronoarabinoxylan endo-1,4-beta-xylanase